MWSQRTYGQRAVSWYGMSFFACSHGNVKLKLRLAALYTTVACFVTELNDLNDPFDVILGSNCMSKHFAVMIFEQGTCALKQCCKQI